MSDVLIPLSAPRSALRHVEAQIISLGFHPVDVVSDGILVQDDRLFCTCCGESIDRSTFVDNEGRCSECRDHSCAERVHVDDFLRDHLKVDTFLSKFSASSALARGDDVL